MNVSDQLLLSLENGFLNRQTDALDSFKPKLLVNERNAQVLYPLLQELEHCHAFSISVAFITTGGLSMLKGALADLATKNVRGRILTSTYLQFNQPNVFEQLLRIPNVDVRVTDIKGFHAKGYIFEHASYKTLIVGSSNLTESALKTNYEWNVKLNSLHNGELLTKFEAQFEHVWQQAAPLTDEWLTQYRARYVSRPKQLEQTAEQMASYDVHATITPNAMQQQALAQLHAVRVAEEQRALVISATGTGKTYLAAFDVAQVQPKKMLFIVHREQILNKAMSDFARILNRPSIDFGLVAGAKREFDRPYVFATIQTLSKPDVLAQLQPDLFDYILVDEVHKAGAASYRRVLDHFTPAFLLGMTATPERTDDFNIVELFNYNIAYEIRLQQALEEEMLCPFHYFGVSEYTLEQDAPLSQLVLQERVDHIIDKIEYYGHYGDAVKGLMFCSKKEEARQLSVALNERGYKTAPLTGDDSIDVREETVAKLETGELDYILTVDIFNEGIDIPVVNQIVMLRQTQSSIIFIQQLGRGLRKHPSKKYVTIIDFIGNYQNNYMIPMALSGDYSFNKDNLRRHTVETMYISGVSSIHFEEVAKERIFAAINVKTLMTFSMMKKQWLDLQYRLGRMPLLEDFMKHALVDPEVLLSNKKNYDAFVCAVEKKASTLDDTATGLLNFVSQELINGKRLHEVLLLKLLLNTEAVEKRAFIDLLQQCNLPHDDATIASMERVLTLAFSTQQARTAYNEVTVIQLDDTHYRLQETVSTALTNGYVRTLVNDVLQCALRKNERYDATPLTIGAKYSRKDYCRLRNWSSDMASVIYGYKIDAETKTCPLFIRYHKDESLNTAVLYEDELLNTNTLKWFTRHGQTTTSKTEHRLFNDDSLTLDVFIQKDGGEGTDFYYVGTAKPLHDTITQHTIDKDGKPTSIVSVHLQLQHEIDPIIYHYLTKA